jgi:hypothetical protein
VLPTLVIQERYEYGEHPVMTLAGLLHPRYRARIAEVRMDERLQAEKLCSVLGSKNLPSSGIGPGGEWQPDTAGRNARVQLGQYRNSPEVLGMVKEVFEDEALVKPAVWWWGDYGERCPELQDVCQRLFSIPATSAAGERVFSALAHIWSNKRNRLLMGRAAMLTYVYFNARVMQRLAAVPSAVDWDDFGDYLEGLHEPSPLS